MTGGKEQEQYGPKCCTRATVIHECVTKGKVAMPLSQDEKDEIRELVAAEMKSAVKEAVNAVLKAPHEGGRYPTAESMQKSEDRKKIVQEVGNAVVKAFEKHEREAQARVVEKTDPERAERIRKFDPTF